MTWDELRSLEMLHEGVADALAGALSAVVRSRVEVRLAGVDELTYGKLASDLPSPSYFAVLKAEPLSDCLMLDIELAILYPMLDRMLGGGHENEPPPRRQLSDVELPLAGRVARLVLESLCQAWRRVLPLEFEVLQVESHPRQLRLLPSEETVAVVGFDLTLGQQRGMIRFCIPCRAMAQIGDKFARAQRRQDIRSAEPSKDSAGGNSAEVVVTLAAGRISSAELRGLRVGDVIATDSDADTSVIVSVDGRASFLARPGACRGHKAVVLSEEAAESPPSANP